MSDEQQYLSPAQQDALFAALKAAGHLTTDQGQDTSVPDAAAQAGVTDGNGPVDYSRIQNLFRDVQSGHPVAMQDGDKIHPMDAIKQITQQMLQGSKPNQNNMTAVQPETPGHGVGSFFSKLITGHPIMHDVGNPIVGTTNAPNVGNLPPSMRPQPIGTDASGKPIFDYAALQKLQGYEGALATAAAKGQSVHPTLPQEFGEALNKKDYQGALDALKNANIPLTPQVQSLINGARKGDQMSQAMLSRVATMQTNQGANFGDVLSAAKSTGDFKIQNDKVTNAIHATQLMSQYYDTKTGQYNIPKTQYNEFTQTAAKILTNNPVLSNEQVNQINQRTAAGDIAGALNYVGATDENGNLFTGSNESIINNLADTIIRQGATAQSLRDNYIKAALTSYSGLEQTNPVLYKQIVKNNFGSAPDLVGLVNKQAFGSKYQDIIKGSGPTIPANPSMAQPGSQPIAPAAAPVAMIRVKNLQTGQTGTIPAANFNPVKYQKL